jgi:hypothetical protein
VTVFDEIVPPPLTTLASTVSVPGPPFPGYESDAFPDASTTPVPVLPAFGPETTEKLTVAPCSGVLHAAKFAVTAALSPTVWLCVGGVNERTAPVGHGGCPIETHFEDSLAPTPLQFALSKPPVLRTCPESS